MNTRAIGLATTTGCAAALLGCAAPLREVQTVHVPNEVRVHVPVPCLDEATLPAMPSLAGDSELARLDDRALVLTIEQQRRLLREYGAKAAAALLACTRTSATTPKEGTK